MRTILHCDLNSFYASVEIFMNPQLKGKAVAVCGSAEERHGIVLAKSDLAKSYGVKTGEAIWEAKQKCPNLIITPPRFDEYAKFSELAKNVYKHYTDLIEPFGMDECWLDVTGSERLFGSGKVIAEEIRERMKKEVGLTVSIGVSFNKVFAKLGSDLKKPDAVSEIPYEHFREIVKKIPASDMLGVGRSTAKVLGGYCIDTIGDLAETDVEFLERKLGKCGNQIWLFANGRDNSPVNPVNYSPPIKSVGHGTTCSADLLSNEEVRSVFIRLSQDIARRLRKHKLFAGGIQISVRDKFLCIRQFQCPIGFLTQNFTDIYETAYDLFVRNYDWHADIRSLTVRAINLSNEEQPEQLSLMVDYSRIEKLGKAETAIERIREKYGAKAVDLARLMTNTKTADKLMPCTLPQSRGY